MTLSTLLFIGEPIFLIGQHLSIIDPISKRIFSDNKIKQAIRIGNNQQQVLELELDNGTKVLIKPSFQIQITECCTYRFGTSHQYGIINGDYNNNQDNETNTKITFEIKISPHIMTNLLQQPQQQQQQSSSTQQSSNNNINNSNQLNIQPLSSTISEQKKDLKQLEKNGGTDKISSSISIIDLKSEQLQQQITTNGRDNRDLNNLFEYFIKPGTYELTKTRNLNQIEIENKNKCYSIEIDYSNNKVIIKSNSRSSFFGNSCTMDIEEFNNTYEVVIYNTYSIQSIAESNLMDFIKVEEKSNRREKIWNLINERRELFKKELTINKDNIALFDILVEEFCTTKEINIDMINSKNPYLMDPLNELSKLFQEIHLSKSPKEILHQILYESHYQLLLGKRLHDPLTHLSKKMDLFNTLILHIDSILKESNESILVFGNFESCKRKLISFLKDNNNGGVGGSNSSIYQSSSAFSSLNQSSFNQLFNQSFNGLNISGNSMGWSNSLSIQENFSTQGFPICNSPFKKWSIFKCPTFNEIRNDINSSQSIDYIIERSKSIKCLLIVIPIKEFYIDNGNKVIETIESFKERFPTSFQSNDQQKHQQSTITSRINVQIIVTGCKDNQHLKLDQRIKQLTNEIKKNKEQLMSTTSIKDRSLEYQICSCLKKENLFQQLLEMEKNGQIHLFEQNVFKRIPLLKSIDSGTPFTKDKYKSTMNNPIMQNRLYQSLEIFALTWTNILSKFLHSEKLIYQQEYNNYLIQLEIEKLKLKISKSTNQLFEFRQKEAIYKKNLRELLRIKENAHNQSMEIKNDIQKRSYDKCKERLYALSCELDGSQFECSLIFLQHANQFGGDIKQYIESEIKRIESDSYDKELEDCIKFETKKLIKRKMEIKSEETILDDFNKKLIESEKEIQLSLKQIQLIKDKKKSLQFVLSTKNLKNSLLIEKIIQGLSIFNLNNSTNSIHNHNNNNNNNIFINATSINNSNIDDNNIVISFNGNISRDVSRDGREISRDSSGGSGSSGGDNNSNYNDNSCDSESNCSSNISSGIITNNSSSGSIGSGCGIGLNSSHSSIGHLPSSISYSSIGSISKEKNIFILYLKTHDQYQNFIKDKRQE